MCTGRIDLDFILRAFSHGADGVFIGGCWPGECHYITEGNYIALSTMYIARRLLKQMGIAPERVRLEYIAASEGNRFAEVVNDFSAEVRKLGPLGKAEGIQGNGWRSKLDAARGLVPYVKLVEREKLRIPVRSEKAYNDFYQSEEFERLYQEFIGDKLEISQMMAILRKKASSPEELSELCGIQPTDMARHLHQSAMHGWIAFDESRNLVTVV
jgi:NADH-quinone oxidoreductase subunit E